MAISIDSAEFIRRATVYLPDWTRQGIVKAPWPDTSIAGLFCLGWWVAPPFLGLFCGVCSHFWPTHTVLTSILWSLGLALPATLALMIAWGCGQALRLSLAAGFEALDRQKKDQNIKALTSTIPISATPGSSHTPSWPPAAPLGMKKLLFLMRSVFGLSMRLLFLQLRLCGRILLWIPFGLPACFCEQHDQSIAQAPYRQGRLPSPLLTGCRRVLGTMEWLFLPLHRRQFQRMETLFLRQERLFLILRRGLAQRDRWRYARHCFQRHALVEAAELLVAAPFNPLWPMPIVRQDHGRLRPQGEASFSEAFALSMASASDLTASLDRYNRIEALLPAIKALEDRLALAADASNTLRSTASPSPAADLPKPRSSRRL